MKNKENKKYSTKEETKSSLGYSGKVTIKLLHKDKVYKVIKGKNSGYLPLFEYIALCLSGTMNGQKAPKYIRTFSTLGSIPPILNKPTIGSGIPYSSVEINTSSDKEAVASFTFLIPGSAFNKDSGITDTFAIYSQENYDKLNNPSVIYQFDNTFFKDVDSDSNIVVVWEMGIKNNEI